MRRRVLPTVIATIALAIAATGCGVTDEKTLPGVAARVDGETLDLGFLDQVVTDYCAARDVHPQASALLTGSVRTDFVIGWLQAKAVEALIVESGADAPTDTIQRSEVEAAWGELGEIDDDNYDSFEWLTWVQTRLGALSNGGPQAVEQVTDWLLEREPDINPVFGDFNDFADVDQNGLRTPKFIGDRLSVPVSDAALAGDDGSAVTAEQLAALPDAQRCGPAAPAQVQLGG